MGIEFHCSQCGSLLRVEQEFAGRLTKCPSCGQVQNAAMLPAAPEATVEAAATNPFVPASAIASVSSPFAPTAMRGGQDLNLGDLMQWSWDIYKQQIGMCVIATLIYQALIWALLSVEVLTGFAVAIGLSNSGAQDEVMATIAVLGVVLGVILLIIASGWLQAGMTRFFLKLARSGEASLGELFNGGPFTLNLVGAGLLSAIAVGLGTLACFVPGVILFLMFSQAAYLIVDRRAGVIESLRESKLLTDGQKVNLALVIIVGIALAYAASIVPFGMLFAHPYISLLATVTYLKLVESRTVHPAAGAATGTVV